MKGIIITILILIILPISAFAWLDTTGDSTTAVSTGYDDHTMMVLSFDKGTDSWKVEITSGSVTVTGSSVTVTNFPSDYPDSVAQASLSSIDGNLEHCDTNDIHIGSGTISDSRFINHVTTGTAGKLNFSGSITVTGSSVTSISFYSDGGDTEITSTFMSGTIYALDGIPIPPVPFPIPIANPTFLCVLPANTTFYYIIPGAKQQ